VSERKTEEESRLWSLPACLHYTARSELIWKSKHDHTKFEAITYCYTETSHQVLCL